MIFLVIGQTWKHGTGNAITFKQSVGKHKSNKQTNERPKLMNALKRWRLEKQYRAKLNLLAHVHKAIAPLLEAKRKADDLLDRCTRTSQGIESQGYANSPGSSRLEIHTLRPCSQLSNLTVDNEPVGAMFIRGMDKAENETRGFNLA